MAFFWTKIFSVVSIFFIQLWFYSTVFWLFYHSTFFNGFIFKLIHPLNIACLAGCLFLLLFIFWCVFSYVVHKEIRFHHTKAELRTAKETMGEGARGEGWENNHLQSTPQDFEMPHPVLWKEKLAYTWYDVSWSQTLASKLLRQRFVVYDYW